MFRLAAMLLISAFTLTFLAQNEGNGTAQSNKPNPPSQNAQHKKKMPPPATPRKGEVDQPTLQYNQTNTGETKKPVHNWIDLLNALSTLAVAIATVVMVVVAYNQHRATKRAERAWVVADTPNLPVVNPQTGDAEISWILPNNGRTPAWVTELGTATRIERVGEELPENPPYTMSGPFPPEGSVLTPTGRIERGITIPAANMAAVEQGTHTLYVFGIVKYRDIFENQQEYRYCFKFHPGPTADNPAPRGFYVGGPAAYNKAT